MDRGFAILRGKKTPPEHKFSAVLRPNFTPKAKQRNPVSREDGPCKYYLGRSVEKFFMFFFLHFFKFLSGGKMTPLKNKKKISKKVKIFEKYSV